MAEQIDLGGGSMQMCEISPADQVGIINNLMDRIQALERAVSQLLAVNVSANQLSDLSQQVGWVYNVTYMGQPGWIQTEAGTLIPPAGFSLSDLGLVMSDGNSYPVVSVDSDGVLQFGFGENGLVAGVSSGTQIAIYYTAIPSATGGHYGVTMPVIKGYDPDNLVSIISANTFKTNVAGVYELSLSCGIHVTGTDEVAAARVDWNVNNNTVPGFTDPNRLYGPYLYREGSTGNAFQPAQLTSTKIMYIDASTNQSIQVTDNANATSTTTTFGAITLAIRLLKAF